MPLNFDRIGKLNIDKLKINQLTEIRMPFLKFRDPAAERIDVEVLSHISGRMRVTGTIRNRGNADFESGKNQAGVHLYRDGIPIASQTFESLKAGETLSVSHEFTGPGGDIPPTFKLMIMYDPDIFIDGNPNNDDAVATNNVLSRRVDLHELMAAAGS